MLKGINYILVNDSVVASLVGMNEEGDTVKVYPIIATQEEKLPLVTTWEIGRIPEECKGVTPTTFNYSGEVHVFAKDYDEANAICNAIEIALQEADVESGAINGVQFDYAIRVTNRRDGGYIAEYKAIQKILTFEAVVNESPAT